MLRYVCWAVPALCGLVPMVAQGQEFLAPYPPPPYVSYYAVPAPTVVRYAAPVAAYYPPPVAVSTYRYGLFGQRSLTTVNYAAPLPVAPAPYVSSYYYGPRLLAPRVAYYGPIYPLP